MKTAREYAEKEFHRFKKIFDPPLGLAHMIMFDANDKVPIMAAVDTDFFSSKLKKIAFYEHVRRQVAEVNAVAVVLVTEAWVTKDVNKEKWESDPPPRNVDIPVLEKMGYCRAADVMLVMVHTPLEVWTAKQEFVKKDGVVEWVGEMESHDGVMRPEYQIFPQTVAGRA